MIIIVVYYSNHPSAEGISLKSSDNFLPYFLGGSPHIGLGNYMYNSIYGFAHMVGSQDRKCLHLFWRCSSAWDTSCWGTCEPKSACKKRLLILDTPGPRACRFRKHQIKNSSPDLALPTFFQMWFKSKLGRNNRISCFRVQKGQQITKFDFWKKISNFLGFFFTFLYGLSSKNLLFEYSVKNYSNNE
jgi:hypothetical protein